MYLSREAAFKYFAKKNSDETSLLENKVFNKLGYICLLRLGDLYAFDKNSFLSSIYRGHSNKKCILFPLFSDWSKQNEKYLCSLYIFVYRPFSISSL